MPYINIQQLEQLEVELRANDPREISWQSACLSHPGKSRQINEDAFLNSTERNLWAVADGMGGLSRGDYASGVSVESLLHFVEQSTLPNTIVSLEAKLREAHAVCRNTFKAERVGSTVVVMYAFSNFAFFLWAGDSRVYRLRDNELQQLTTDHTVAQRKIASGELSPARAALDPSAHVLTRAIGVHQTLHLDLHFEPIEPGDQYLLCSDGLYNEVSEPDIQQRLQLEPKQAVQELIDKANDRGGRDNITAIVVEACS